MKESNSQNIRLTAPFKCILCGNGVLFTSDEHIIPHSLGNDILLLEKGWVCDECNNICSAFETRVLSNSVLGVERCRLGVITKKKKPARSDVGKIAWFAEPDAPTNTLSAEADWSKIPILLNKDLSSGKIAIPIHNETCPDIARLLLKIGLEIILPIPKYQILGFQRDFEEAKRYILGIDKQPYPYFVLCSDETEKHLVSIFHELPAEHEYIQSCGFDIFFHFIDNEIILFFNYGQFKSAICLTSRQTDWRSVFIDWGVLYVGCPIEFQHLSMK